MFVGDTSQHIVLIQPFEQRGQFTIPPLGGVNLPLYAGDFLPGFGGILAGNVLGEQLFFLLCVVGNPLEIVQNNRFELGFPDIMRAAFFFAALLVGGAHKVVLRFFHGVRPVKHQRTAAVGTEHGAGEKVRRVHLFGA